MKASFPIPIFFLDSTMRNLLGVILLLIVQSLAKPSVDEGYGDWFADTRGRPSSSSDKCKKDLLLIVDMSFSITKGSYKNDVIPFLKKLVKDPTLNVGEHGTHIAVIIFSQKSRTKIILRFGDKYNKDDLAAYFENMRWEDVSGDRTRTDLALELADNEIFTMNSPGNHRADIDDVIILITDGEPKGKTTTKQDTITNADELKDKDVLIVVAAVGPKRKDFKKFLEQVATSKEVTLDADFKKMDKILDTLIASSCFKPGECNCYVTESSPFYVKPGESKASISWPQPTYKCGSGGKVRQESVSVVPNLKSPQAFSVGKHIITYNFNLNGGVKVTCPVILIVKGPMCRGKTFNSRTQVCCCGTIHAKKPGHKCCGQDYYNISLQKCCSQIYANLVSLEESCPGS